MVLVEILQEETKVYQILSIISAAGRLHDRDNSQHRCYLCDIEVQDKVIHCLFTCISLQERRDTKWQHIANAKLPAMVIEMDEMDDVERTTFLANGLNGTYIIVHKNSDICKIDVYRDYKPNE